MAARREQLAVGGEIHRGYRRGMSELNRKLRRRLHDLDVGLSIRLRRRGRRISFLLRIALAISAPDLAKRPQSQRSTDEEIP